jgi:hypothetical protein
MDRETYRKTNMQTNRQAGRERQTDKEPDRNTDFPNTDCNRFSKFTLSPTNQWCCISPRSYAFIAHAWQYSSPHTIHSCSHNVQLHELLQLNKIYKYFLKEIIWWEQGGKKIVENISYRCDMTAGEGNRQRKCLVGRK